jgi:DNA polymerase III subunit delta'
VGVPFDSLVGHLPVREALARGRSGNRLPHALLFTGPDGIGKRTLALELARGLLCESGRPDPCGACGTCRRTAKALEEAPEREEKARERTDEATGLNIRLHPDMMLVRPWPQSIKIEQVRQLVGEALAGPFESKARAFVIDEAHMMTEQAQNALLKSLEEPPPTSYLLLVTSAPQALLPTIRSRCQRLRMGPLPSGVLEAHLRQGGLSAEEARLRAALSAGSLGAALALDSEEYRQVRERLLGMIEGIVRSEALHRLEAADWLAELEDVPEALTALRSLLRDVAALHLGAPAHAVLNGDVVARLGALAAGPLGPRAENLALAVGEAREALRTNANKLLTLDILLDTLAG